jgi:ABC-type multidrug transport system ATPase subunit
MNVEIRGLTKIYAGKVEALKEIDLTIPPGMFGLLGPNGAGKTTLMRILAGILPPSAGQIRVGPHDARTERGRLAVKRVLGYLPQELGLYPDLSAREFLHYIGILKGLEEDAQRERRVDELLELVALREVGNRKLKAFSGGMKRRVGIAQALLNDPQLLIVDEPTAGLDPEERIRFRTLLVSLSGDRTILLSTHIVEDIGQTSSRLAVLARGRVAFAGDTSRLIAHAQGQVWTLTTPGPPPVGDLEVVAALHGAQGVQYRVVAQRRPHPAAVPVEPTLEDGYVALQRQRRESATAGL